MGPLAPNSGHCSDVSLTLYQAGQFALQPAKQQLDNSIWPALVEHGCHLVVRCGVTNIITAKEFRKHLGTGDHSGCGVTLMMLTQRPHHISSQKPCTLLSLGFINAGLCHHSRINCSTFILTIKNNPALHHVGVFALYSALNEPQGFRSLHNSSFCQQTYTKILLWPKYKTQVAKQVHKARGEPKR